MQQISNLMAYPLFNSVREIPTPGVSCSNCDTFVAWQIVRDNANGNSGRAFAKV